MDVYPAAEHSTISSASINSSLIPIQHLTNEADQDHSSVTSWLKHAESCNIHSHQRNEEWKQSLTKVVTEMQQLVVTIIGVYLKKESSILYVRTLGKLTSWCINMVWRKASQGSSIGNFPNKIHL